MTRVRTLTINPALDLSAATEAVTPTEKLRCHDVRRDAGGGGINVARVMARLGGQVEALFPAGGPVGETLARLMRQEGLAYRLIPIAGETREDFTILDESAGRQYRFVLPGPVLDEAEQATFLAAAAAGDFDIACASGSLPPGVAADFYARLAERFHQTGKRFLLDTSGPALRAALNAPVDLIKPNLKELGGLTGTGLESPASQLAACRSLLRDHPLKAVALSLGPDGAMLVTEQGAWHARCQMTRTLSTVGAGDSFMGGLTWALAEGLPPEDMLRVAAAAGTATVMTPGTELCHAADVWRLRDLVELREIPLAATA